MVLPDVNVLVYSHRTDSAHHSSIHDWLKGVLGSEQAFGISNLVLSGFLRVVTNPKAFLVPTPLVNALAFVEAIRNRPNCVTIEPGPRHWSIFERLCRAVEAKGNLVPDAYLAALAIESGCEWISTDNDFGLFPDLHWQNPLR
jgi:toxin-antitoxin system PIN domain toxin